MDEQTLPGVVISNRANGSTVSRTVSIMVSATDDIGIARLELYIGGVLRSTVNGESLSFSGTLEK